MNATIGEGGNFINIESKKIITQLTFYCLLQSRPVPLMISINNWSKCWHFVYIHYCRTIMTLKIFVLLVGAMDCCCHKCCCRLFEKDNKLWVGIQNKSSCEIDPVQPELPTSGRSILRRNYVENVTNITTQEKTSLAGAQPLKVSTHY